MWWMVRFTKGCFEEWVVSDGKYWKWDVFLKILYRVLSGIWRTFLRVEDECFKEYE